MRTSTLKALLSYGQEILQNILFHQIGVGGKSLLLIGEQGSGKSTILLRLALMEYEEKEIVIWRGREAECIHYYPLWNDIVTFWCYKEDADEDMYPRPYKIYEHGGGVEEADIDIEVYTDPKDLIKKIRKRRDKIHVVYEPKLIEGKEMTQELLDKVTGGNYGQRVRDQLSNNPKFGIWKPEYFWYDLLYELKMRPWTDWVTVCVDEVDDIIPPNPSGVEYYFVNWLRDSVKDLRKTNVSLFMTVHNPEDVYYGIIRKIQYLGVTRGARIPKYWYTGFIPNTYLHSLRRRFKDKIPVFLIEGKAEFGIVLIQRFPTPKYQLKVFFRDVKDFKELMNERREEAQKEVDIVQEALGGGEGEN